MYTPNILFEGICDYLLKTNGTLYLFLTFLYTKAKLVYLFVVKIIKELICSLYENTPLFIIINKK
jgi:hypothetical protein